MSSYPTLYCPNCGHELRGLIDTIGGYQWARIDCSGCGLSFGGDKAIEQVEAALMQHVLDYWHSSEETYRLALYRGARVLEAL